MIKQFCENLKKNKTVIAMIHVPALPGTPGNMLSPKEIIYRSLKEAETYINYGIDTVAIENMHDAPYLNRNAGPEITSMMSVIGHELKSKLKTKCGIQVLAGANKEALACAHAAGLDFIRAEGFVFAHVADEGLMNSDAGELLRYRKMIGAENIAIFTDIKKKHSSHSITSDISINEAVKAAEFFKSDGIIITGKATGQETMIEDIKEAFEACSLPVIIGSGITPENISKYYNIADGFIIGSYFKTNGVWSNNISKNRIKKFMNTFEELRG